MPTLDFERFMKEMKDLPLVETAESCAASYKLRKELESYAARLKPEELTQAIDFLEEVAASSPYRDIDAPGAELHHRQTSGQDVSLTAVRTLAFIASLFPEKGAEIVGRLDTLAQNSQDWDIRKEAIGAIGVLVIMKSQQSATVAEGVAALEAQGATNSNAYIRMHALASLFSAGRENEQLLPRAIETHIRASEDPDKSVRMQVLAALGKRAVSRSSTDEEAKSLLSVFEKAAAKKPERDEAKFIEERIVAVQKRLKDGPVPRRFP